MAGYTTKYEDDDDMQVEPIYLLYDERMLQHRPIGWIEPDSWPEEIEACDDDYPMENPERIRVIYERLLQVEERLLYEFSEDLHCSPTSLIFQPLHCEMATKEQILLAHSEAQYDRLDSLKYYSNEALAALSEKRRHDVYYCQETFKAARLAAGGLLSCVDAVCDATVNAQNANSATTPGRRPMNKAMALVRPPGHHACQEKEMGFCFVDSVVIAAKYALAEKKANRVVILDWDIHDGNGTAEATINDENIFRIDLHRFNPREGFYPYTGPPTEVGSGQSRGLNLNMAWSHGGMGNTEYAAAFHELILPLLVDFQPDMLIISCGLDAAMGDLLGGCDLTPDFYHAMTRATIEAVGPETPIVCALEGGYSMSVIPDCMEAVTLAMLNCQYQYHSALQLGSYLGGAAIETKRNPWPGHDRLERSRRALSKYYIRDGCSSIIPSAIHDINTSVRIFKGIGRWKHIHLHKLKDPYKQYHEKMSTSNKRKYGLLDSPSETSTAMWGAPFQRPRVYLWYGTELHHRRKLWW